MYVINKYYFQVLLTLFMAAMLQIVINFWEFSTSLQFFSISHLLIICLSSLMIKFGKNMGQRPPPPPSFYRRFGLQLWDLI